MYYYYYYYFTAVMVWWFLLKDCDGTSLVGILKHWMMY